MPLMYVSHVTPAYAALWMLEINCGVLYVCRPWIRLGSFPSLIRRFSAKVTLLSLKYRYNVLQL
jgi:hypothetical protein